MFKYHPISPGSSRSSKLPNEPAQQIETLLIHYIRGTKVWSWGWWWYGQKSHQTKTHKIICNFFVWQNVTHRRCANLFKYCCQLFWPKSDYFLTQIHYIVCIAILTVTFCGKAAKSLSKVLSKLKHTHTHFSDGKHIQHMLFSQNDSHNMP